MGMAQSPLILAAAITTFTCRQPSRGTTTKAGALTAPGRSAPPSCVGCIKFSNDGRRQHDLPDGLPAALQRRLRDHAPVRRLATGNTSASSRRPDIQLCQRRSPVWANYARLSTGPVSDRTRRTRHCASLQRRPLPQSMGQFARTFLFKRVPGASETCAIVIAERDSDIATEDADRLGNSGPRLRYSAISVQCFQ